MSHLPVLPRHTASLTGALLITLVSGGCLNLYGEEAAAPASTDEIVHVLNRTSFGIRPGDVEAVQKMGLKNYIQQQLHPETIDDSATDQAVAQLSIMGLSQLEICNQNHDWDVKRAAQLKLAAQLVAQNAAAGAPVAPGATTNAATATPSPASATTNLAAATLGSASPAAGAPGMMMEGGASTTANAAPTMESPAGMTTNAAAMSSQAQVSSILANDGGPLPTDKLARLQELLRRGNLFTPNLPPQQLQQAKLIRAIDSNRQLQEVLVDFWTNHFNVDTRKDNVRIFVVSYDRDVIRPHIWGSFHDLLEATTKSPAMLLYLDNASNVVPNMVPKNPKDADRIKRLGGLNENYGREIMELHTLGVDAGYTQKDVQEVARCFTGWTYDRKTGDFVFKPELHDNGPKTVLGHDIPANGGIQDGETVLDLLVSSPQCAHFIAKEMCERFVSDDPPPALVNRIAGVFTQTKGDLRSVTEAILTSREFLSPSTFGNKVKSPEEFTISAVRASGSTISPDIHADLLAAIAAATPGAAAPLPAGKAPRVSHAGRKPLRAAIAQMGEPLYNCAPPTGYKEISTTWVNPGTLIDRLNFAVALTEANVTDVTFDAKKVLGDVDLDNPDVVLNRCVSILLANKVSDSTRNVLVKTAVPEVGVGKTVNPSKLIALILGSPEFQKK